MKSTIRKIGNSRGILIPASFLEACEIEKEIELRLEGNRIVIQPVNAPRSGWFDNYRKETDEDAWAGIQETGLEREDWQW